LRCAHAESSAVECVNYKPRVYWIASVYLDILCVCAKANNLRASLKVASTSPVYYYQICSEIFDVRIRGRGAVDVRVMEGCDLETLAISSCVNIESFAGV